MIEIDPVIMGNAPWDEYILIESKLRVHISYDVDVRWRVGQLWLGRHR